MNGVVKHDMFPDWSEIMLGYRVDTRQLFINNELREQRAIGDNITTPVVSRDSQVCDGHSSDQRCYEETHINSEHIKRTDRPRSVNLFNQPDYRT